VLQDQPHAGVGAAEAFHKNAAEHDRELAPVHVVLSGGAVEHERAKEHLDEQRLRRQLGEPLPGRDGGVGFIEIVVLRNGVHDALERVALSGELAGDFAMEQFEVVIELQADAGKDDLGADLRRDGQVVPGEPQLPQQSGEWAALGAFGGDVGEGMQADIVVAAAQAVEGIETADRVVPLDDAHPLIVVGEPDARRQTAHAAADDEGVVHGGGVGRR
jgi:hypothetical protein